MQVMATLRQVGCRPQVAALGRSGVVALWPNNAAHDSRLRARTPPGERIPPDVEGLTVELTNQELTIVLQRRGGGYMRRTATGSRRAALATWAARAAALATPVRGALIAADAEASVGALVQVVDALIAPCLTLGCAKPVRRLLRWQLIALPRGAGAGDVDPPQPPAMKQDQAAKRPASRPGGEPSLISGDRPGRPRLDAPGIDIDLRAHIPLQPAPLHRGRR